VTHVDHRQLVRSLTDVLARQDWQRLSEFVADDAVFEFPQSGETFDGLANIRGQFENYPGMEEAAAQDLEITDIVGGMEYGLTPTYTLVEIEGSGTRGTFIARVRYPDGSRWWAVNLYELRDNLIVRCRLFFSPELDPPDWRAPFRTER
jgi:hypothetical protein